jgi:putative DNA primase/helicase
MMSTHKSLIALGDRRVRVPHYQRVQQSEGDFAYEPVLAEAPDLTRQRLNDVGNAQRFAAMFGADVHYAAELKRWLIWDGNRWKIDVGNQVQTWAKYAMLEFLWQAGETYNKEMLHFAERSLNMPRLRHLLEAAQSEPGIPVELSQLDRHPLLLNVRNGVLNLATRELDPHRRDLLLTKLVDVDYDPSAQCPRWIEFLSEILAPEQIAHVQKALGYCLSADVSAKAVFVCHGAANAGKTTMLGTFRKLTAEYSTLLLAQTLTTHSRGGDALADLADLNGARFVQISEFGQDEHLAQRVLKAIVQGAEGRIKARRKYANMIEFRETWKVWFDTNALPQLADPYDPGIPVRLHPIHFAWSISPERIDKALSRKLEDEFPGILNWLVEGFRLYLEQGLERPPSVEAALTAWLEECDHIPRFVNQCCVVGSRFSVELRPLFEAYQRWCSESLERPMSAAMFSRGMRHYGYKKDRNAKKRFYLNIKLVGRGDND